jgi:hypothetical protein
MTSYTRNVAASRWYYRGKELFEVIKGQFGRGESVGAAQDVQECSLERVSKLRLRIMSSQCGINPTPRDQVSEESS